MKRQGRHILLVIDNASSHVDMQLSNVKIVFLPPNLTSELQPLDQGIIRAAKMNYRKWLLDYLVAMSEEVTSAYEFSKNVTILQAIRSIVKSWNSVTESTIHKCFR